jgi:predicted Zn-ribbon and HTH transcriptional regulator
MKLTRFTKISMIAVGTLLLAWVVLMFVANSGSKRTTGIAGDGSKCPDCGIALPKLGADCPRCLMEKGEAYLKSRRQGNVLTSGPGIPIALGCILFLLMMTHIVITVRNHRRTNTEEVFFHVRCTKCGRKLRYREKQIDHLGKCPLCQKPIRFPKPPDAPRLSPWGRIAQLAQKVWE